MKKSILKISGVFLITAIVAIFWAGTPNKTNTNKTLVKGSVYDFKLKTIDGAEISLSKFKGKKLLLINVASECGYTPQYKNLQALHEQYGSKLILIGFPANNFGKQEPGTNTEIKSFCTKNYGVTFLMMDKISVTGSDAHPLYKWLSSKADNGVCENAPNWNFCKYLIDEKGNIIKFFPSKVDPLSSEITSLL
jgi:glutathione peroxidase